MGHMKSLLHIAHFNKQNWASCTGASGTGRGSVPSSSPNPKSILYKKKREELTGKEIAAKITSGSLTSLNKVLQLKPRQISKVIEEKATLMLNRFLEVGQGRVL